MGNRLIYALTCLLCFVQAGFAKPDNNTGPVTFAGAAINFSGNKVMRYERVINNPTSAPVAFSFNNMPQSDSDFIARYVLSQVTNPADTEATKLEIIKALINYFKSPYFANHTIPMTATDSVALQKQCSVIGMINSDFSTQCGNYVREVQIIALKTGYFSPIDFESLNLNVHVVGQVKIQGYFCLFDADPASNGGLFPFDGSPNGYARMKDVRNDSTLIVPYLYQGQVLPGVHMSLSEYRDMMVNETILYYDANGLVDPLQLSGEFKIAAGGTITATAPAVFYFMDTSDAYTHNALSVIENVTDPNSGLSHQAVKDTFIHIMMKVFNTDSSTVSNLVDTSGSGIGILYDSRFDQGKKISEMVNEYDYSDDSIPQWVFSFNADTTVIGRDIKAPLLVLSSTTACNLEDTAITGPAEFKLWDVGEAPKCDSNQVNYLQHGLLFGPGNVSCAVNIGLIDPFADWTLNGDSANKLVIENQVTVLASRDVATGIKQVTANGLFKVYPNPAINEVTVSHACRLFNANGQMVTKLSKGRNAINLATGTYFVTDGVSTEELIVQ